MSRRKTTESQGNSEGGPLRVVGAGLQRDLPRPLQGPVWKEQVAHDHLRDQNDVNFNTHYLSSDTGCVSVFLYCTFVSHYLGSPRRFGTHELASEQLHNLQELGCAVPLGHVGRAVREPAPDKRELQEFQRQAKALGDERRLAFAKIRFC